MTRREGSVKVGKSLKAAPNTRRVANHAKNHSNSATPSTKPTVEAAASETIPTSHQLPTAVAVAFIMPYYMSTGHPE